MDQTQRKRDLKLVQKVTQFREFNLSKTKEHLEEKSLNTTIEKLAFKARPVPDFVKPSLT